MYIIFLCKHFVVIDDDNNNNNNNVIVVVISSIYGSGGVLAVNIVVDIVNN